MGTAYRQRSVCVMHVCSQKRPSLGFCSLATNKAPPYGLLGDSFAKVGSRTRPPCHGSGWAAAAPFKYPTTSDSYGRRASHVMETRDRSSHLAFSPLAGHSEAGKNGGGQVSMQGRWKQQGILSIQGSEDAPGRHCNRQHGLAVHTATSPHHQFPTVGFALCLEQKQLHHKPWRGAKRRGQEVGASWPQHEIAVRGHVWAEGAQNGRKAEAEADGDGDGEGEKEKKAVTSQTVPYQLFM